MITKSLLLSVVCAGAVAVAFGGPKLKPSGIVRILDNDFVVVRVLDQPAEIEMLRACFGRAKKHVVPDSQRVFAYKIDVEARWLYDAETGEFMLLSKAEQPLYRLKPEDRDAVNALIRGREADQRAK